MCNNRFRTNVNISMTQAGIPTQSPESSNQWRKNGAGGSNVVRNNAFKILQRSLIQTLLRLAEPRSGQAQTAPMTEAR